LDKYLVIGGNGVIGHFVARRLVKQGHRPVIMSRGGDTTLIADIRDQCDNVRADMTDSKAVDELVREHRISHIVHLGAALPTVAETDPAAAVRLNVEGTANVLEAARKNGVKRVVMASTKAVYGPATGIYDAPTYTPLPESKLPEPQTVYGITKLSSEQLGRWYSDQHGIEFIALRFGATIGPGKIARHGGAFSRYSVIVENAMAGKAVEIGRGADALCDGLFNDEAARGILCALQSPNPRHHVYNIATGTGFTLRDYAAAVQRLYPAARISISPDLRPTNAVNFVLDVSRARDDLGFVADRGVDRIVEAYASTMQLLGLAPDVSTLETSRTIAN
jgi:UDP-glucose 4-epimerase